MNFSSECVCPQILNFQTWDLAAYLLVFMVTKSGTSWLVLKPNPRKVSQHVIENYLNLYCKIFFQVSHKSTVTGKVSVNKMFFVFLDVSST